MAESARALIEAYEAGAARPWRAIEGLARKDLLAHPVPGTWSIQQIVLHLMDCDLIASERMKRIIAMENPLLVGFDENAFVARLGYEKQDAHSAAEVFRLNRELTATALRELSDDAFGRRGVHSERGVVTLRELIDDYVKHLDHHMRFLLEKKRMLGHGG